LVHVRDIPASLWTTARFRLAGAHAAVVTVNGRPPLLMTGGTINCTRLMLRSVPVPALLGATKNASLTLGHKVFINTGASVVANTSITLGDGCLIGDFVAIYDTDFHQLEPSRPVRSAPVRLGVNVWVGRSAMILPGVTIGDHAVVAAGSVVTEDVPARTLVAGVPARAVRTLAVPDEWRRS
jgi:acetyltransferase-like isoleucine patch superfamily enzyme